jgi:prevent-host-death family protein
MTIIKLSEAKAHLGKYARKAAQGQKFIIADRNKPVAVIGPAPQPESGIRPKLGLLTGQATIPEDFDTPPESFENDF